MSKQTAVDYLFEKLCGENGYVDTYYMDVVNKIQVIYEEAKAMEREQMIDAYSNGWHDGQDVILQQCKHIDKGGDDAGQQYYNTTYKGE